MARSRASRVTKPTSSSSSATRATRHRSRFASAGSSSNALQNMVDEISYSQDSDSGRPARDQMMDDVGSNTSAMASSQRVSMESQEYFGAPPRPRNKGKVPVIEHKADSKPFPIMELPTEIRLEIYRACLTRPHKILLSKVEKPAQSEEGVVKEAQAGELDSDELLGPEMVVLNRQPSITPAATLLLTGSGSAGATTVAHARSSRRVPPMNRSRTGPPSRPSIIRHSAPSTGPAPASEYFDTRPGPGATNNSDNLFAEFDAYYNNPSNAFKAKQAKQHDDEIRAKKGDALIVNILRASKQIYKEARDVLYSENVFDLDITTAVNALAALHQRSRRHIKQVELEIPTYTEILERFSEVVRLSLRYCTGLQKFVIHMPFTLPGADGSMSSASNATVYANGFDILRWLPQQCQVVLQGNTNEEIEAVVRKHLGLAKAQDMAMYERRMFLHHSNEQVLDRDEKWRKIYEPGPIAD